MEQHIGAGGDVGCLRKFADIMADAADARHEDHRGRTDPREHLGIVTGAAGHASHRMPQIAGDPLDPGDQRIVEQHRREACELAMCHRQTFGFRRFRDEVVQTPFGRLQDRLVGVAQIDGETGPIGDDVDQVGPEVDGADGRDLIATQIAGQGPHEVDRRAGQVAGIMAQPHGCRSGVVRDACNGELDPGDTLNRFDGAQGNALLLQYGPLFDMQLHERFDFGLPDRGLAPVTDALQRRIDARAVDSFGGERFFQCQAADIHQTAHHVGGEARAFFIGEDGNSQRMLGLNTGFVQAGNNLQPRKHTQVAVIAASRANRIDMRSGHHRWTRDPTGTQTKDVADGVD